MNKTEREALLGQMEELQALYRAERAERDELIRLADSERANLLETIEKISGENDRLSVRLAEARKENVRAYRNGVAETMDFLMGLKDGR